MNIKRLAWIMLFVLLVGALPALAQNSNDLDATFEAEDGSISFAYPSAWYADKFYIPGYFIVATSESKVEQMRSEESTFPSGEMLLDILSPQVVSDLIFEGAQPATIGEAMELLLVISEFELGEPEAVTIGDYNALVSEATEPESEGLAYVIEVDNGVFMLASAMAAPGEFGEFEDTVMAILASITYAMPEGMIAFTSEDGSLTLEYPAGWSANEQSAGSIVIKNEMFFEYTIPSGHVMVSIATPPEVEWFLREGVGLPDDPTEAMARYWTSVDEKELGEVSDVSVGNYTGTRLDFTTTSEEGYILLLDVDGGALAVQITVATGELADFDTEVTAILESFEYTPLEGEAE